MKRSLVIALLCLPSFAHAQNVILPSVTDTKNSSVTITAGNVFQTVLAAITQTSQRRSLTIQNNNLTDSCWVFVGSASATKAKSILLLSGEGYSRYFPFVPNDVIQATCTTTADTLYIDVQ